MVFSYLKVIILCEDFIIALGRALQYSPTVGQKEEKLRGVQARRTKLERELFLVAVTSFIFVCKNLKFTIG